jgi:endoplasmic reticulum Man9GlcNAc2 1,2-alpha-mannosidase
MLRPEILESVFIAWRLTGEQKYRDFAWNVYQSIEAYARVPPRKDAAEKEGPTENDNGYATVLDVDQVPVRLEDKQETFFLVCSSCTITSFQPLSSIIILISSRVLDFEILITNG